jgi:pimeloyl-ACP methyl ester carboxylesterase
MPQRIVSAGDVNIWTEDLGSPADPALLLVMGANASAMAWPEPFVHLLAAGGRHVIRYDHRDTGKSTTRTFSEHPYALGDMANDAVSVLDGHGIRSAHVVGFSMGATIGQLLAIDHRDRLLSLTLIAGAALDVDFVGNIVRAFKGEPSPDGLPTPDRRVIEVLAGRANAVADTEAEIDRRVAEWRALSGNALPFDEAEFRSWERRAIDHAGTRVQPRNHAFATPAPLSRGADLGRVTTPTLVVQAALDPLNPPPHGRHLADLVPGARLAEIAGMGHALPSAVHRPLADLILAHTAA